MGKIGRFFRKVGKAAGAIATAIVPGFDALAKTGIMGSDLAAFAGGPQTTAVQQTVAASPLAMNIVASPAVPTRPAFLTRPTVAPTVGPVALSGRTVTMPVEYAQALVTASRPAPLMPGGPPPNFPGARTQFSSIFGQQRRY